MIKAKIGDDSILLGLSRENMKRLTMDQPIKVELSELGMKGRIFIVWGETEQDIIKQLKEAGLIGPDTIQHGSE